MWRRLSQKVDLKRIDLKASIVLVIAFNLVFLAVQYIGAYLGIDFWNRIPWPWHW